MLSAADLKENEVYHGFSVLEIVPLPEYASTGIWVRHDRTGLEVFHLYTNDSENLFAFAFKTPADNARGAAHILEHSVLNGSEKYPLKDPFVRLVNQSIKTFLNAITFPDKTVFPASSQSRTDYFNLMSVYGDAVFFPLLSPQCFAQEAHRLELDKDAHPVIQGVVYNEMKGCYSSFENIAGDASVYSLFEGTPYMFDSGGDPAEIPLLTHEELKQFHKRYYSPRNCRVFLYGDIPTKEQLDFLDSRFLCRMTGTLFHAAADIPAAVHFEKPRVCEFPAPVSQEDGQSEKGCTVTVNWRLGDSFNIERHTEVGFLSDVLLGNDGAPLIRALLECGLGEDICPNTGADSSMREMFLTVGLRGVPREKAHEVETVIFSTLQRLCQDGIPAEAIDSALMGAEISNREIKRVGGPYSLTLMRRSLRGWLHGCPPYQCLYIAEPFERLKKRISADKNYVCTLIQRLLLDNVQRSLVVVYPDETYSVRRVEREKELADMLFSRIDKKQAEDALCALTAYQQQDDSEQACRLIPHIHPDELSSKIDRIDIAADTLRGTVPYYISKESTNGIIYIDIGFPVDTVPAEYLPLLPMFATALTNTGYDSVNWAESALQMALHTGGMGASVYTASAIPKHLRTEDYTANTVMDRKWLFIRFKTVREHLSAALDLTAQYILHAHFSDSERLRDLVFESRNDLDASVIPAGHEYAVSRAVCQFSTDAAFDEIWNGLAQVYTSRRMADMDMTVLGTKFDKLRGLLCSAGCVVHITAEEQDIAVAAPLLDQFICVCDLHAPLPASVISPDEVQKLLLLPGEKELSDCESILIQSQTGFAALATYAGEYGTKQAAAEYVLAHLLGTTQLWEQIRTVGGAYGVFAAADGLSQLFYFSTYRDPKPLRSLEIFASCLTSITSSVLNAEILERAVTGCYSKLVQPRSPAGRGFTGFIRSLYGITNELQEQRIRDLLTVSADDVYTAANRIHQNLLQKSVQTMLYEKSDMQNGNIVRL